MRNAPETGQAAGWRVRTRIGVGLVMAMLVATAGAGCSPKLPPLTIGISLSLTGDLADQGAAARRGYELWADTANANGGVLRRRVSLKIIDDASLPERAAANYEKLIDGDKVDLVMGPFSSKLTIPSSQVAAKHGYAFVEPAGGAPAVFEQRLSNLFFVQPAPAVQQGAVFGQYILSLPAGKRPKTAAYTVLDDPFAAALAAFVREKFEKAGIRTVFARTYPEGTDLLPIMKELASTRPDVLFAATQNEDGYATVNSLVRLRWAPTWLYLANGANSPLVFPAKVGPANVNGIFTSGDWFPTTSASGNSTFVNEYLTKYGGQPDKIDSTSVEAYSAGLLLEQVAAKTGRIDNATIIATLHQGAWLTPVGDLSWDAYGSPKGSFILFQWIEGKLQSVFPGGWAQRPAITTHLPWARSAKGGRGRG
jgi:branched-chain amino acid transport system substrate-binding protein